MSGAYQTDGRSLEHSPNIDPDKQSQILKLAAEGLTIQDICKSTGIPWTTLGRFIARDPLFETDWVICRKIGNDLIADSLQTMYDDCETMVDAVIARGRSENIKTIAAWRNPQRYGSKVNIEVTHSIDLSKALQQAEHRTIPILEQAQIDRANQVIPPVDKVDVTLQHSEYIQHVTDKRQNSPHVGIPVDKSERAELRERARKQAEIDKQVIIEVEADHDFERFL